MKGAVSESGVHAGTVIRSETGGFGGDESGWGLEARWSRCSPFWSHYLRSDASVTYVPDFRLGWPGRCGGWGRRRGACAHPPRGVACLGPAGRGRGSGSGATGCVKAPRAGRGRGPFAFVLSQCLNPYHAWVFFRSWFTNIPFICT